MVFLGLIAFCPPSRRRSRVRHHQDVPGADAEREENLRQKHQRLASFTYKIRDGIIEVLVCAIAFCSIFGITKERLRRIRSALVETGNPPIDKRGRHANRPRKTPERTHAAVINHIKSFKCRQSHYSRRHNPNVYYLPETLSCKKMYRLFCQENEELEVSYKIYWQIFTNEFKLKFGVPRSDTCGICDNLMQKRNLETDIEKRAGLETEKKLHLCKAEKFYQLKKHYRLLARQNPEEYSCISFDYMQNLPVPHIRTNEVFYAIQMWYYVFGIHNEGNDAATMYCYDETVAKKGQNDVTSLLFQFLKNHDLSQKNLILLSDGCAGQNKNYVMMRFLYMLVHCLRMFETIVHIFPVRGHSFLSNDRDFSLIEKHKKTCTIEVPSEWDKIISEAREKPSQYELVKVKSNEIFDISTSMSSFFLKNPKPPVKIKTARMLRYDIKEPGYVLARQSYSGEWERSTIRNSKSLPRELSLTPNYEEAIALKPSKIRHLKSLAKFIRKPENIQFYDHLLSNNNIENEPNVEIDNDDNSSGASEAE